jgi:hypothetical protein
MANLKVGMFAVLVKQPQQVVAFDGRQPLDPARERAVDEERAPAGFRMGAHHGMFDRRKLADIIDQLLDTAAPIQDGLGKRTVESCTAVISSMRSLIGAARASKAAKELSQTV